MIEINFSCFIFDPLIYWILWMFRLEIDFDLLLLLCLIKSIFVFSRIKNSLSPISSLYLCLLPCHDKSAALYYYFHHISPSVPTMLQLQLQVKPEAELHHHQPGRPGLGRPRSDGPPSQGDTQH